MEKIVCRNYVMPKAREYVLKGWKFSYWIGYWYRQIFAIQYWLSEYLHIGETL